MATAYDVIIKKKIPVLSKVIKTILYWSLFVLVITTFLLFGYIDPNNEMQVVTVVNAVPNYLLWLEALSLISFVVSFFLHAYLRVKDTAVLQINSDVISLFSNDNTENISINDISKIEFLDASRYTSSDTFTILIYSEKGKKCKQIELKYFLQCEEVMNEFLHHDQLLPKLEELDSIHRSTDLLYGD